MGHNIGNNNPVELNDYIKAIEDNLGIKYKMNFLPLQPSYVPDTYANVDDFVRDFDYHPATKLQYGGKGICGLVQEIFNPDLDRCNSIAVD